MVNIARLVDIASFGCSLVVVFHSDIYFIFPENLHRKKSANEPWIDSPNRGSASICRQMTNDYGLKTYDADRSATEA